MSSYDQQTSEGFVEHIYEPKMRKRFTFHHTFSGGRFLKARIGEWDASNTNEPIAAQEFTVSRIFIHPSYVAANLRNDIAVLRLSTRV